MRTIVTILLCYLLTAAGFGQKTQNHTVYFKDMDGFTGQVTFMTSREGFATQLRGKKAHLYITDYQCTAAEKKALQKAGMDMWPSKEDGFEVQKFGVVISGHAYVQEQNYYRESVRIDKLQLSKHLGDFTTPEFDKEVKVRAKAYQRFHKTSYWEDFGGFKAKLVKELYLTDLKSEISRIITAYKRKR